MVSFAGKVSSVRALPQQGKWLYRAINTASHNVCFAKHGRVATEYAGFEKGYSLAGIALVVVKDRMNYF
jgi:hypothetical protein